MPKAGRQPKWLGNAKLTYKRLKIMKNKTYLIQTEDRYGRSDEFELKATSKANAEEIANWHWNVINGSIVINVIEL